MANDEIKGVFNKLNEALLDSNYILEIDYNSADNRINRELGRSLLESEDFLDNQLLKLNVLNVKEVFYGYRFGNRLLLIPFDSEKNQFLKGFYFFEAEREPFLYFSLNCFLRWGGGYFENRNLEVITCIEKGRIPFSSLLIYKGRIQYMVIFNLDSNYNYLNETVYLVLNAKNDGDRSIREVWSRMMHAMQMFKFGTFVNDVSIFSNPIYRIPASYYGYNYTWHK